MQSKAATPDQYLKELPADRKEPMTQLRNTILKDLPKGFKECMTYGMIGYVVPHEFIHRDIIATHNCRWVWLTSDRKKILL
jgi:hypothetical protein